jgi:GNAT superfamily N-acetyltransferase
MSAVMIRGAEPADAATIVRLVRELAEYEELLDRVRLCEEDVLRDGFGAAPRFECLLAEVAGEAAGLALFFHNYSTFEGRPGIYLEDFYVAPRARGQGLGRRLLARLAAIALERNCARLNLSVLKWNPARQFYHRIGFAEVQGWLPYRLQGGELARLAREDDAASP